MTTCVSLWAHCPAGTLSHMTELSPPLNSTWLFAFFHSKSNNLRGCSDPGDPAWPGGHSLTHCPFLLLPTGHD